MPHQVVLSDDFRVHAARLAYALLRFEKPVGLPLGVRTPAGMPVVRVELVHELVVRRSDGRWSHRLLA